MRVSEAETNPHWVPLGFHVLTGKLGAINARFPSCRVMDIDGGGRWTWALGELAAGLTLPTSRVTFSSFICSILNI